MNPGLDAQFCPMDGDPVAAMTVRAAPERVLRMDYGLDGLLVVATVAAVYLPGRRRAWPHLGAAGMEEVGGVFWDDRRRVLT